VRCNKVKKILSAYLDGELSERKAKQVKQHLVECSACTWELNSFQRIDELGRWMAEVSEPQLPGDYWEGYLDNLHDRLEQAEGYQQPDMAGFFNRCWNIPLTFAIYLFKKIAPGLATAVVIAALVIGGYYLSHRSLQIETPKDSERGKVSINFYLKEHETAVTQATYSAQPSPRGIELGYEDVFYYDTVREMGRELPGEKGIFLRAPRHLSHPSHRGPSQASEISNGHKLSLQKAQEAVGFKIIAPQTLHPGYFLERIRKVEEKECLQLTYNNGINTISLFEQAIGSEERFHSGDFREYAMYSKKGDEPVNVISWNSAEVSFTLIGEESLSQLMGIIRAIQEDYLENK